MGLFLCPQGHLLARIVFGRAMAVDCHWSSAKNSFLKKNKRRSRGSSTSHVILVQRLSVYRTMQGMVNAGRQRSEVRSAACDSCRGCDLMHMQFPVSSSRSRKEVHGTKLRSGRTSTGLSCAVISTRRFAWACHEGSMFLRFPDGPSLGQLWPAWVCRSIRSSPGSL